MSARTREPGTGLRLADLHESVSHPLSESMNFLNEVAQRYPDAISLAAGRPTEAFFDLAHVHRYLDTFHGHLMTVFGGDRARADREMMQYGRTKGIIHELIARHLATDEDIQVPAESIVVTVGCQEGVTHCGRSWVSCERCSPPWRRRSFWSTCVAPMPGWMRLLCRTTFPFWSNGKPG